MISPRHIRFRVLIASDHAMLRHGIKHLLQEIGEGIEVAEAHGSAEIAGWLQQGPWHLLIFDGAASGLNGLEMLAEVRLFAPCLPILVTSLHSQDLFVRHVLRAGASGYLSKQSAPEEFTLAVRTLLRGGRYISASLAEQMVFSLQNPKQEHLNALLSHREYEVMRLTASGKTVSEIGRMLSLSVKTISTYRTRILKKLGLQTSAELIRYAVQNGLVP